MDRPVDKGVEAPPTVEEGGTIPVQVHNGAKSVTVYVGNSKDGTEYPVVDGKVEVPVPPGATGGTLITIMTWTAVPAAAVVEVVGTVMR